MASALRSSLGLALRRAAASVPSPSSRLSSAGAASANTRVRTIHCNPSGGSRSMYDAEAYSVNPVPRNPEQDKFDWIFGPVSAVGAAAIVLLVEADGIGGHFFGWCKGENAIARQPRMSGGGRRGR